MNTILLTTPEAAEALRMSALTLLRWRKAGKGPPFIEMGRKVFYRRADLEAWIQQQQRQPETTA